jgi:DNA-binding IclR family transcriptional regulator
MPVDDSYSVRAVVRAVHLLDLLRESESGLTAQGLAAKSGLAKASVFRMMRTLEALSLVQRSAESGLYRLGVRCLEFGQAYLEQVDIRREALPVMERLRDQFGETVHLAVLDDDLRVVYLEKFESTHAVGIMMSRIGRTAPSHCTGIGKALLSVIPDDPIQLLLDAGTLERYTQHTIIDAQQLREELRKTRERGYAVDLEEHEPGVRCVAAAIPGRSGMPVFALSISGPSQRMPDELLSGVLAAAVMSAANEIGGRFGHQAATYGQKAETSHA